ncbi:MAG TPA: glucose 1-dehydrogenase [Streptosporangiaceae bacterium]|nr:glucose 1-dehydrogenase [Streptosporangiaceae bacterium]
MNEQHPGSGRETRNEHSGRVALVTGAPGGIGRAVAELLAEQGATVAVNSEDPAAAADVAERITKSGGRAVTAVADVTDAAALHHAVEDVVQRLGRLDILVTCAGIQRYGTVSTTSEQLWDEVFAVNVKGTFLATRAAMPHLRRSGSGAVVIVSSVQASVAQTNVVAYSASKGALNAFARAVAVDEARYGVRVNVISPGSVDTPMLRASAELFGGPAGVGPTLAAWGSAHPLGRIGRPREIAQAVSFLASERASFITGEDLRVDGGLLAAVAVVLPDADASQGG